MCRLCWLFSVAPWFVLCCMRAHSCVLLQVQGRFAFYCLRDQQMFYYVSLVGLVLSTVVSVLFGALHTCPCCLTHTCSYIDECAHGQLRSLYASCCVYVFHCVYVSLQILCFLPACPSVGPFVCCFPQRCVLQCTRFSTARSLARAGMRCPTAICCYGCSRC